MSFRDDPESGPGKLEDEVVRGRPAQRIIMAGFLADEDPYWHHQVLLMRFGASKWLAVTPEGDAELLDVEEQKAVRPVLA